jgi:hypothetical protein
MGILFLFTLLFIIAQFFEKSDYDKEKESEKLPPFTKEEAENYYKENFKTK